eukprot:5967512-Prorocentrum_lima.AAC.1
MPLAAVLLLGLLVAVPRLVVSVLLVVVLLAVVLVVPAAPLAPHPHPCGKSRRNVPPPCFLEAFV